jgi:predicted transcriptional regulator
LLFGKQYVSAGKPGHPESHRQDPPCSSGKKRRSKPEIYFTIVALVSEKPVPLLQLSIDTRMNFKSTKDAIGFLIS